MNALETKSPRRAGLGKLAAGALVAVGLALAAVSPAMADDDDWDGGHHRHHGNGHWDRHGNGGYVYYNSGGGYYYPQPYYYYPQPPVYYYQPAPVYVAPPPPPPVYYVQPAPYYERPSLSIILPLHIH